jgi:tetratricopeptide (TPR) repeat protein
MLAETFAAPAVCRLGAALPHARVDPEADAALFDRLVGGQGALATVVVDAEEDPLAVLEGFAEAPAYAAFLEAARAAAPDVAAARAACRRPGASAEARLALGARYRALGSHRRAEAVWRAVAAAPTSGGAARATAHERLARLLVERGRAQEARGHLEAARAGASDADVRLTEGLLLAVERRMKEARAAAAAFLDRHPGHPDEDQALFLLARAHHDLQEDASALAALDRLLARHPASRLADAARWQREHVRNPVPEHEH